MTFFAPVATPSGYLAEIMSSEEENLLDKYLIEGTSYWLGLADLSHVGNRGLLRDELFLFTVH